MKLHDADLRSGPAKIDLLLTVLGDSTWFRHAMMLLAMIGLFVMAVILLVLAAWAPGGFQLTNYSTVVSAVLFAGGVVLMLQLLYGKRPPL